MATVYPAYDPNFRLKVAIKLVVGNLQANDVFREREAQLLSRIEHLAILPVYDYGEHDHDLYMVMRYMPGVSLAAGSKMGSWRCARRLQSSPDRPSSGCSACAGNCASGTQAGQYPL